MFKMRNKFLLLLLVPSFLIAQKKSKERQELEQKLQENILIEKKHQEDQRRAKYKQDSIKADKAEQYNKMVSERFEENQKKELLRKKQDSLVVLEREAIKKEEEQRKLLDDNRIAGLKRESTFSFDSLNLIEILSKRVDSLFSEEQTVKAERIEKKITQIQKLLFNEGRSYTFHLIKRRDIVYYSYELGYLSLFMDFYSGKLLRIGVLNDHGLTSWETSDELIEKYEELKKDQLFTMKVKFLPSKFSHTYKGHKCGHDFNENRCQIIVVNPD